jgi:hypothetical protein
MHKNHHIVLHIVLGILILTYHIQHKFNIEQNIKMSKHAREWEYKYEKLKNDISSNAGKGNFVFSEGYTN